MYALFCIRPANLAFRSLIDFSKYNAKGVSTLLPFPSSPAAPACGRSSSSSSNISSSSSNSSCFRGVECTVEIADDDDDDDQKSGDDTQGDEVGVHAELPQEDMQYEKVLL